MKVNLHGCYCILKSDDFLNREDRRFRIPRLAIHSETMIHCDSIVQDEAASVSTELSAT